MTGAPRSWPLGKDCKIAQPPPSTNRPPRDREEEKRQTRKELFQLQDKARRFLPGTRVAKCGHSSTWNSNSVQVMQNEETGRANYHGVERCSSVWCCPVCSEKISRRRKDELQQALERAKKLNLGVGFLTLTVRHSREDLPLELIQKISKARRLMYNRKPWKRLAAEMGVTGSIRSLEVTHGQNGWHIHTHELFFFKPGFAPDYLTPEEEERPGRFAEIWVLRENSRNHPDKAERAKYQAELNGLRAGDRILAEWAAACMDAELEFPNHHAASLQPGQYAAAYVAKWGLADEITGGRRKEAHGFRADPNRSRTPWDLLRLAVKGDQHAKMLWKEYAATFQGRRQLIWSKGLADLLGSVFIEDDQLLLELERKEKKMLGVIDLETWTTIINIPDGRARVLSIVECFGWQKLLDWLMDEYPYTPLALNAMDSIRAKEAKADKAEHLRRKAQQEFPHFSPQMINHVIREGWIAP